VLQKAHPKPGTPNPLFDLIAKTPHRQAIRRISGVSGTLDAVHFSMYK
jgi:hypothetical protein